MTNTSSLTVARPSKANLQTYISRGSLFLQGIQSLTGFREITSRFTRGGNQYPFRHSHLRRQICVPNLPKFLHVKNHISLQLHFWNSDSPINIIVRHCCAKISNLSVLPPVRHSMQRRSVPSKFSADPDVELDSGASSAVGATPVRRSTLCVVLTGPLR